MSESNKIQVNIGEIKLGKSPDILQATLGSCVGIAFVWKEKDKYGLAHCLLPKAPTISFEITAKYVSCAIPSLLQLMKITPDDYSQIQSFVAGGANMIPQLAKSNPHHIGIQNSELAINMLKNIGITIVKSEIGGVKGKLIKLSCFDGSVQIMDLNSK